MPHCHLFSHNFLYEHCHIHNARLHPRGNLKDLATHIALQRHNHGLTEIVYVNEIACLSAVSVNRDLPVARYVLEELGDDAVLVC